MKIGLVHYSGPPVVGGVEQTLYHHARTLADLGHHPRLIVGRGEAFDPRVAVTVIPEISSRHPEVLRVKGDLDRGRADGPFRHLETRLRETLRRATAGQDVVVVHNALTLHKNLPLTAALFHLSHAGELPALVGWHHDFAWDRPRYRQELRAAYPWDLLRRAWPGVIHVAVSHAQQVRLARLYEIPAEAILIVPPGIDPGAFAAWTETTQQLEERLHLLDADAVLLLPARITRRKNIEYALSVLAEVRQLRGEDVRLVVTGPPGPHNPANARYLEELREMRAELGLERCAHFLYELGSGDGPLAIDDATLANFYSLSDALLFPSTNEGFGIPLLEAGLARLPVFCSDIPPFRETGGGLVHRFPLSAPAHEVARAVAAHFESDPSFRLRRRVRHGYVWRNIVRERVVPILESAAHG
jgi:glycosyltransferase involved in cell wall biosynthesis